MNIANLSNEEAFRSGLSIVTVLEARIADIKQQWELSELDEEETRFFIRRNLLPVGATLTTCLDLVKLYHTEPGASNNVERHIRQENTGHGGGL